MRGRRRREIRSGPPTPPRGERCASCGSEDRVERHQVGAIEGGTPLCRACLRKVTEGGRRRPGAPS